MNEESKTCDCGENEKCNLCPETQNVKQEGLPKSCSFFLQVHPKVSVHIKLNDKHVEWDLTKRFTEDELEQFKKAMMMCSETDKKVIDEHPEAAIYPVYLTFEDKTERKS